MTAVEYFYRHYILEMEQHGEIHIDLLNKLYERSKAMEKQQIIDAFLEGCSDNNNDGYEYYKQTFKSE